MRRRARISATRASGWHDAGSRLAICTSVNPPGCFVDQLVACIEPSVNISGMRDVVGDAFVPQSRCRNGDCSRPSPSTMRWRTALPVLIKHRKRAGAVGVGVDDVEGRRRRSTTSAPGRQTKLRPKTSGCSVRTNTPTRHSGMPAAVSLFAQFAREPDSGARRNARRRSASSAMSFTLSLRPCTCFRRPSAPRRSGRRGRP